MAIVTRALRAGILLLPFAGAVPGLAAAQTAVRPPPAGLSPEELNPARRAPEPEPRARGDLFTQTASGPCPLRDSTLTFTLREVEFVGATTVTPAQLAGSYAGLVGREGPVSTICDIRDRAAGLLFARGVLARVEIPEQRIADGRLRLEVIEARITSVRVRGDAGPAQAKVEGYLDKLQGLTPFDLNTAQRYLLLASDVPGVQISASLRPSSQGRGAVELDVEVSRKAVDVLANVQNFGSKAIGRWGALGRVDLNGFTRFGDKTSLVVYSTVGSDEQRILQLIEELRPTNTGLTTRLSLAYARTKPGDVLAPLNLTSDSVVGELRAAYPLIRRRRTSLNLIGGLDYVQQKTKFAGGGGTLTDDNLRIFVARAEGQLRRAPFDHPIDLSGGLEVRQGVSSLGASRAGERTLSRIEGRPDALVFRADAVLDTPLVWKLSANLRVTAQQTDKPLLSYEELAVGNLTIGRGYDPSINSGDKGIAGALELRAGPFQVRPSVAVSGYLFYDAARVENFDTGGDNRTLRSNGAGVRVQIARRFDLNVFYAQPLDRPLFLAESVPTPRVLVSLTAAF